MKNLLRINLLAVALLAVATVCNAQGTDFAICPSGDCLDYFPRLKEARVNLDKVPLIVRSPNEKEIEDSENEKTKKRNPMLDIRFGFGMDVNYGMSDGIWTEKNDKRIWAICIAPPMGTIDISAYINNFQLAPNAEMYVYSQDGKFVEGPFTEKMNSDRRRGWGFWIGIERCGSTTMVIQIIEPANSEQTSTIQINRLLATFSDNTDLSSSLSPLLPCHEDVVCHPNWENESNGVCRIELKLLTSTMNASGSLLNNTRQDNTPYVLTAFHVLDRDDNGTLNSTEKDALEDY
jgi:hypothetical protein